MYLDSLEIENFRLFGNRENGSHLTVRFSHGINLLIGPNDSGKSCVVDAIRLLVGTSTADYFPLSEDDFHIHGNTRATNLSITGVFRGLAIDEAGALLEYLTPDGNDFLLRLRLVAMLNPSIGLSPRKRRITVDLRAGSDPEGIRIDWHARDILNATYLRPLRDAVAELAAKKGSRLSQILRAYKLMAGHDQCDWDGTSPDHVPQTLVGIARKADHAIRNTEVIKEAESHLNKKYLSEFSTGDSPLKGEFRIENQELRHVLERMELALADRQPHTFRGLGMYNLLFMATELLALGSVDDPDLPLILIEEPEAHLHPQLQYRLIQFLKANAKQTPRCGRERLQVIATSHSPNFASSVPLGRITLMHGGKAFSLREDETQLQASDYEFLERFLDVTKANLFFAPGVIIVEGDAEALLLPVIAHKLGRPLDKYAISIVNVGHIGLFRYARIFQRRNGCNVPVRVACITDRDIPPVEAKRYLPENRQTDADLSADEIRAKITRRTDSDGGPVRTFVSGFWTLEYDLARSALAKYVHAAIALAKQSKSRGSFPCGIDFFSTVRTAFKEVAQWRRDGLSDAELAANVYEPLVRMQASKAESAQALAHLLSHKSCPDLRTTLPSYLVNAIDYVTGRG